MVVESQVRIKSQNSPGHNTGLLTGIGAKSYKMKGIAITMHNDVGDTGGLMELYMQDPVSNTKMAVARIHIVPNVANCVNVYIPCHDFIGFPGTGLLVELYDEARSVAKANTDFGHTSVQLMYTELDY